MSRNCEPQTVSLNVCALCVRACVHVDSCWGVETFQKVNVMEPAFGSLQSGWEGKLLMNEMTVMKDGLGVVTLQTKRAQPKPKPRGWDMIKELALDLGTYGRF